MTQTLLQPDEYIDPDDGLIHCRNCRKPRQRLAIIFGHELRLQIPCDCQLKELKEDQKKRDAAEWERFIHHLKNDGLGWKTLWDCRFDNMQDQNSELAYKLKHYIQFLKEPAPCGLLFWGPPGRGKTFAAACIVNDVIESGYPAVMVSFSQLLEELTAMSFHNRKERLDSIFSKSLVCLDDFDLRFLNKLHVPLAIEVMNRVDHCNKPVLITTCYTLKELKDPKNELEEKLFPMVLNRVAILIDGDDLGKQVRKDHVKQLQTTL